MSVDPRSAVGVHRRILLPALLLQGLILAMTASSWSVISSHPQDSLIFFRLFAEDWRLAAAGLGLLIATPFLVRIGGVPVDRSAGLAQRHPGRVALACTLVLALGAHLVYLAHPLAMDEFGALFQARVFAAGHLTGQIPPDLVARAFGPGFVGFFFSANPETGQIVSNYWPGFSLLLTPFAAIGAPFLLNPIIGGATILAIHRLATRLLPGTDAGGWAVLLTVASPAFLINSMSLYAMPAHLLANTVYALLLIDRTPRRLLLAGLVGAFALALHQPFPHAVFALPWILWIGGGRNRWRDLGMLAAGYAPPFIVLFGGWAWISATIHSTGAGYVEGFGHSSGTMAQRAVEMVRFIFHMPDRDGLTARVAEAAKLVIWAVPTLPILAVLGVRTAFDRPGARALAASAAMMGLAYLPVAFDQGHGWGNRYFEPAWMALPVFAAAAIVSTDRLRLAASSLRAAAGSLALVSMVVLNGVGAWTAGSFIRSQLAQLPDTPTAGRRIVMIDVTRGYYTNDLVQNDPFLRGQTIRLWGTGQESDDDWVRAHFIGARVVARDSQAVTWTLPSTEEPR